ncbi:MAG: methyltransferase family protein, partial [Candidatus Kariarchaeaceae archaeon]
MILAVGVSRWLIYLFWELLLEIMSFIPQHPFKDINYFVGFLSLPSYIDFVVIGSGFIFLLIGSIIFLLGVYALARGVVENQPVVTGGFYRYIRHPQNLGLIMLAFGFMLLMPLNPSWPQNPSLKNSLRIGDIYSWLLFALFWLVEAKWEEERLVSHLGSPYQEYMNNVPFIIPAGTKIETILSRFFNPSWKLRYRMLLWIS